jgi:hypothetical protein
MIIVRFINAGLLSPSVGAFGIMMLSLSKQKKFKTGMILSVACIFLMAMIFVWHYVDLYFIAIMSGEIITNQKLFGEGVADGFIILLLLWMYQRLLRSVHLHGSNKWSGKKTFLTILRLLYFFLLFLFIFWVADYYLLKASGLTHLNVEDSAILSGAIALLATGIPLLISFSRFNPESRHRKHHRSHRHHRESTSGDPHTSDDQ